MAPKRAAKRKVRLQNARTRLCARGDACRFSRPSARCAVLAPSARDDRQLLTPRQVVSSDSEVEVVSPPPAKKAKAAKAKAAPKPKPKATKASTSKTKKVEVISSDDDDEHVPASKTSSSKSSKAKTPVMPKSPAKPAPYSRATLQDWWDEHADDGGKVLSVRGGRPGWR